ncbi:beta strand repeat-containing protein [Amycolatopsis benzoatilytica]|uniref:beta strand repeat-containing protein n=1 Tax=Amycolatopsis benzoatilytica TaxID=346045 RepID=UPI00039CB1D8|nr:PE-PGRS family protein [Amycolatopsis benzoatilytica]
MQTWAKRGLQTALVTGGLLMLGTGIASADENVNPDTPASPLDLNVTVPIDEANNAIGTPLGQVDLPAHHNEISTKPVTSALKSALASAKTPGSAGDLTGALPKKDAPRQVTPTSDAFKGNKVNGDVVVPIQIVDNAVGVIGDAHVQGGDHDQTYSHNQDVATSGKYSGIAGNVVALDYALPVQIAGNGVGLAGGSGAVKGGSAHQSATETGNIDTTGKGSGLSGNVVAGQFATPVQVTGNAASWILGNAYSGGYNADTAATSGGSIKSNGKGAAGSGNVVGAPIALPVKFNGNAGGVWGSDADSTSNSSADAKAGDTRPGSLKIPTYMETDGDGSFLSGNAAAAQASPVANVASVAGSWIGNATTGHALDRQASSSTHETTATSGGFVKTSGENAAGAANVIDPAVALPVEACGVGGTYIGNAHADCTNTTTATSGDGSYTRGNGSVLTGNIINSQVAGAPEVHGIGGSHIGNASGTSNETKTVTAGNYDGSQGNDSSGSGNIVQVPVAAPAEVFGVGGSFIGQGSADSTETKVVKAGGGGNTADDNGFLSSNLATAPLSTPVQLFGIGGAFVGQGHGKASNDTTSTAGQDVHATGDKGAGAGNLVEAPVSLPVQGHGVGGAVAGIGTGMSDNLTDSKAGGNATATGKDGALAGNIVKAPIAGAGSIFGDGLAGAALGHGTGTNDVTSASGGTATTNGDGGAVAGDIVGADAEPVAQVFGDAVSAAGVSSGDGMNNTVVTDAGEDATSGMEGSLSGDILDLPVPAVAQVFGDAVAAGGVAHAVGENQTNVTDGNDATHTDGSGDALSGFDYYHPFGALVQVYDVPLEVLGVATAKAPNATEVDPEPAIDVPIGGEMGADQMPALPNFSALSGLPGAGSATPALPALPGLPTAGSATPALPGLPGLPTATTLPAPALPGAQRADVPQISGLNALGQLNQLKGATALPSVTGLQNGVHLPSAPALPALPGVPSLPGAERADVPGVPAVSALPVKTQLPTLQQLPAVTALPAVPGVPATMPTTGSVPSLGGFQSLVAKALSFFKK